MLSREVVESPLLEFFKKRLGRNLTDNLGGVNPTSVV